MKKIRDNLYLGDNTEANNLDLLKNYGITTILSVTFDNIKPYHPQQIKRIQVAIEDNGDNNILLELAVNILDVLLDNEEVVFVHCAAGLSRSPFVIAKTLSIREDRDLRDCCDELCKIQPGVNLEIWLR